MSIRGWRAAIGASFFLLTAAILGCAASPTASHPGDGGGVGGGGGGGGAGSGGVGGGGGGGGSGGGGGGPVTVAPGDMISDLETGDDAINKGGTPPRVGYWYVYHDTTVGGTMTFPVGLFTPASPGRDGAGFAARMAGSGFTDWGAGMAFNLNDPGDGKGGSARTAYDASSFSGIALWAMAPMPTKLRVSFPNKDTDPQGGLCDATKDQCNDHFGVDLALGTAWQQFVIPFSSLKQEGWSGVTVPKFDAQSVYGIQFQVPPSHPFDVWVDDIGFVR